MAIVDYDSLLKEVLDWTHRDDLDTRFDVFLQMCEVEISSNPDESLKILSLDSIATTITSTTSRFLSLPAGMNLQRKLTITIDGYNCDVNYTSPGNLVTQDEISGIPVYFTISNNQIEFDKIPDEEYVVTINYQLQDSALSVDNPTNVILSRYPNIYLFGCLSAAFSYSMDDQQAGKYSNFFLQAIKDANEREKEIKYPSGMNIKAPRVV